MPKKRENGNDSDGLWIAPRHSLKGPAGDRAWENRRGGIPSNTRFLELADIALGLKKAGPHKKKPAAVSAHDTLKNGALQPQMMGAFG